MKRTAISALVIGLITGAHQDPVTAGSAIYGGVDGAARAHHADSLERDLRAAIPLQAETQGVRVQRVAADAVNVIIPDRLAFEPGTSTLTPTAYRLLDDIARSAAGRPGIEIFVTASNPNDPTEHVDLARERAHVTAMQLQSRGVAAHRMTLRVDSAHAKLEWAGEDLLSRPLQQRYAAGMRAPQTDGYPYRSEPQPGYQGGYQPGHHGNYERRSAYGGGGYQPQVHYPSYGGTPGASQPQRIGLNGVIRGITTAVTQGPEAGIRTAAGEMARDGINAAMQEARGVANEEIGDFRRGR